MTTRPHQTQRGGDCLLFLFGGGWWIRTTEVSDNRFTVCPLWPLGKSPICCKNWSWRTESNHQPADYKSAALPLSHTSVFSLTDILYHIVPFLSRGFGNLFGELRVLRARGTTSPLCARGERKGRRARSLLQLA